MLKSMLSLTLALRSAALVPRVAQQPRRATIRMMSDEKVADFSKIDLRVGTIVSAWNHPDSDKLIVEEIDIGEDDEPDNNRHDINIGNNNRRTRQNTTPDNEETHMSTTTNPTRTPPKTTTPPTPTPTTTTTDGMGNGVDGANELIVASDGVDAIDAR